MRPTRLTTKFTASAAFGLVLGAALLVAPAPARAGDDEPSVDTKFLRGLLEGLGLKRDGEAGINYQERAPLVIPPGRDLPPPETSDALVANNPAWPKDPDIARRKQAEKMERNRKVSDEREHEQNPLRPDELTPGVRPSGQQARTDDGYQSPPSGFSSPVKPSELGYTGGIFKSMFGSKDDQAATRFTGEPPRASLTDPPPGYQTPSPDQPYGAGKAAPPKAENYLETHGELPR